MPATLPWLGPQWHIRNGSSHRRGEGATGVIGEARVFIWTDVGGPTRQCPPQSFPRGSLDEERDEVTDRAGDLRRRNPDRGFHHGRVHVGEPGLEALTDLGHLARFG